MKAVKSEKLMEITESPENREKFRKFIATRSSTSGQFVTKTGTSTTVEFVVGKSSAAKKQ
ncbi:hypothetical protein [Geotalea uraniireducens]|uniref:hypothetical protein n=1 Tax=Geotalea uraniireducens TaxID=351604 RepID=UPI0002E5D3B9|nr:hypothetical protein [Geotalea uraniireducens]